MADIVARWGMGDWAILAPERHFQLASRHEQLSARRIWPVTTRSRTVRSCCSKAPGACLDLP